MVKNATAKPSPRKPFRLVNPRVIYCLIAILVAGCGKPSKKLPSLPETNKVTNPAQLSQPETPTLYLADGSKYGPRFVGVGPTNEVGPEFVGMMGIPGFDAEKAAAHDPLDAPGLTAECLGENWQAAVKGNAAAQLCFGVKYAYGYYGLKQNYTNAIKWFRKAAEKGSPSAQCFIGVMYEQGWGVPQDSTEAIRWFQTSAKQANPDAECWLAVMYEQGRGVATNSTEALKWLRQAAEHGHEDAQYHLGVILEKGQGVPQNLPEALKWIRKVAENTDAGAQFHLSTMYAQGRGTAQDYVEAYKWRLAAAAKDDKYGKSLDILTNEMTKEQIAEGRKRAAEFMAGFRNYPTYSRDKTIPQIDQYRGEGILMPRPAIGSSTFP